MRYGVISDVHGNLQALQAAFGCLDGHGVDRYLVAGDLVGYGANPNECIELVAAREPICVAGNHDLIALGQRSDERCIELARLSLRWTRSVLTRESRAFLAELPALACAPGGVLVAHGALDDPEEYVERRAAAQMQLARVRDEHPRAEVLILGHTHQPWAVSMAHGVRPARRSLSLPVGDPMLLNPGAVGQSRGLRPLARFLLLDLERRRATFLTARYEFDACRAALQDAGLPVESAHLRPSRLRAAARAARSLAQVSLSLAHGRGRALRPTGHR